MSEIETFCTGGQRESKRGKGRFDLISPRALFRLARVCEEGARKRGERNWEKGLPLHSFLDSALRHITQLLRRDTDEDHAAHALWNLAGFIHTQEMIQEGLLPFALDDLPRPAPVSRTVSNSGPQYATARLATDDFLHWLEDGPRNIQRTFDHFREEGWTVEEILDVKEALVRAGKVDYYGGQSYCLANGDAPHAPTE